MVAAKNRAQEAARRASPARGALEADPRLFVSGVDKGLRVLRAFYNAPNPLSLTEIAKLTGLGVSACQRFLYTLKMLGYVRQDGATRRYSLSAKVLDFGYAYLRNDHLVEQSFPYLLDAHKRTDETVNLTELDGSDVIYVSRFPSRNVISVGLVLGTRLPAFCTAPGRAMLAFMPQERAVAVLEGAPRQARTPYTVTDLDSILADLELIRQRGYAFSDQETYLGDISVAAPVRDHHGQVVAAVNVALATPRWSMDQARQAFAPIVMETARAISKVLGGA
ncbi:IclR family transcriptional regulator [Rhodoligotrophos defluvii]|uniref:IclR family transcriptional regulator n=1 Tax=Rhodoligotrophos defluvii TaxID=2561934 RepID=UPI0010C99B84|nr:IclR family transcriptional regulator C-terminal domain-containing protein [Rhodoligotrophos defluvii]